MLRRTRDWLLTPAPWSASWCAGSVRGQEGEKSAGRGCSGPPMTLPPPAAGGADQSPLQLANRTWRVTGSAGVTGAWEGVPPQRSAPLAAAGRSRVEREGGRLAPAVCPLVQHARQQLAERVALALGQQEGQPLLRGGGGAVGGWVHAVGGCGWEVGQVEGSSVGRWLGPKACRPQPSPLLLLQPPSRTHLHRALDLMVQRLAPLAVLTRKGGGEGGALGGTSGGAGPGGVRACAQAPSASPRRGRLLDAFLERRWGVAAATTR